jgi:hypothetical protein
MSAPSDTSPEAHRVLSEVYRRLHPSRKWEILHDVIRLGRDLHAAGVTDRNPDASWAEIRDDWVARNYGPIPESSRASKGSTMSGPTELQLVLDHVVEILDRLAIVYALGGSFASSVYGISRSTIDADICVEPFPGKESLFADSFGPDFYVSREAIMTAVRDRSTFNVIQTVAGFKIDVFVRKDRAFDVSLLARRRLLTLPAPGARPIYVVSPEDILVVKLEWYRLGNQVSERQWSDVLGVLRAQAGRLDEGYLDHWAAELEVSDLLAAAREEVTRAS